MKYLWQIPAPRLVLRDSSLLLLVKFLLELFSKFLVKLISTGEILWRPLVDGLGKRVPQEWPVLMKKGMRQKTMRKG